MAVAKKSQWTRAKEGYFTLNREASDLAIEVARNKDTTVDQRERFAKTVNSSANSIYQAMRDRRKLKAG